MQINEITGRSAFLALLREEGVTHLFGNPGTTELPIMHALKEHPDLTYVLGLQESLVVAMADGFSRASGQLTACNVHVAPGLGNAMGSIYNAKFTNTPMIITAGQQEQGHGLTEPLLYDSLVPMAAPLVKWAVEITRLEDMPRIVHRAAKIAMTPPMGPVFISLPGDILNSEVGMELGNRTRVDTASRPSDETLIRLADRILAAKNPAIISGNEVVGSDALEEVARFAETLGAAAYQQTIPFGSHFLSEHPAFMGALTRNQKQVRDELTPYDLLVVIGADPLRMSVFSEIDPLPADLSIVQIGLHDWEMGKNYPTEIAVRSDVGETLKALIPVLKSKGGDALAESARSRLADLEGRNWVAKRTEKRLVTEKLSEVTPIAPDYLMMQIVDALPADAMVVNESLTSGFGLQNFLPYGDRYSFHGNASGGIGWAVPAAVGIQLAQPDRPLVAIIGDGSAMYSIQALWTAAKMKLPINFVITNNGGYRIIKQRLLAFHGNDHFIGMDFEDPAIDFVALAQSMGVTAQRVTSPDEIRPALDAAISNSSTMLLDIAVDGSVGH
jgi:benzoylformate decarboxylase